MSVHVLSWFAVGAGAAAYLYAWRYYAGRIAWHETEGSHRNVPNGGDVAWGIICGFFVALAAPVAVPYELLKRRGAQDFIVRRVLYTPAERRGG